MKNINADVLIVGAGMAGLMAARTLQENLLRVLVVDKGPRVGGRLATEQIGPGRADFGAQFFTTSTSKFQCSVERWLAAGLVYNWSTGWSDGSMREIMPHGHCHYAARGGMQALVEYLAQGSEIRLKTRIVAVEPVENGWQAKDEEGQIYASRALLLTPPIPLSLALLKDNHIQLLPDDRAVLNWIKYAPCLVGLFRVAGAVHLPEPGAIRLSGAPVSWIADNQQKGISPEARIITVQATPKYSQQLWRASDAEVLATLQVELQPFLGLMTRVVETRLKRWRYALPLTTYPERCLVAKHVPTLIFAGDAFGEPPVEGAVLSGLAAAAEIRARCGQGSG